MGGEEGADKILKIVDGGGEWLGTDLEKKGVYEYQKRPQKKKPQGAFKTLQLEGTNRQKQRVQGKTPPRKFGQKVGVSQGKKRPVPDLQGGRERGEKKGRRKKGKRVVHPHDSKPIKQRKRGIAKALRRAKGGGRKKIVARRKTRRRIIKHIGVLRDRHLAGRGRNPKTPNQNTKPVARRRIMDSIAKGGRIRIYNQEFQFGGKS